MPKPKKLPSGAWRVQVYSHTENGKRKYESFTAWSKSEVELLAAEYKANKKRRVQSDLTVAEAIDGYITSKEGVLSPATIRGYRRMQRNNYDEINSAKIKRLTSEQLQLFVSTKSRQLGPKSVQNIYGLLSASLGLYQPDTSYRVTLPAKPKKRPTSPSEEAVKELLAAASPIMKTCILLGIRGMREGEISALKYEDVKDGIAHIHADMVQDNDNNWIYKELPKTEDSDRFIKVPDFGTGTGFIVKWNPSTIRAMFLRLRKQIGHEEVRFHDLRHFFASSAAALNIPDIYTADFGGWSRASNSPIMKSVYQNNIKSMSDYYQDKLDDYLCGLENATRNATR